MDEGGEQGSGMEFLRAAAVTHNRFIGRFNNAAHREDRCLMADSWQGSDCMFDTISRARVRRPAHASLMMRHRPIQQRGPASWSGSVASLHMCMFVCLFFGFCRFGPCVAM